MLAKCRPLVLVGIGFALGLFAALLWSQFSPGKALAQEQPPKLNETGRYSISAYGDGKGSYGAYVIDVQTGEVFHTTGGFAPKSVGRLEKK